MLANSHLFHSVDSGGDVLFGIRVQIPGLIGYETERILVSPAGIRDGGDFTAVFVAGVLGDFLECDVGVAVVVIAECFETLRRVFVDAGDGVLLSVLGGEPPGTVLERFDLDLLCVHVSSFRIAALMSLTTRGRIFRPVALSVFFTASSTSSAGDALSSTSTSSINMSR